AVRATVLPATYLLEVPFVIEHERPVGTALAIGEAGAFVEHPRSDVAFAGVEFHVGGAAFACVVHGCLEERPTETASAELGYDVELFEVRVECAPYTPTGEIATRRTRRVRHRRGAR